MSAKKIVNHGLQIGTQNNHGGEVNNAARDIIINKNVTGASLQEFQSLLSQVSSQLQAANLPKSERQDIEAIVAQVLKQAQKEEPKKSLIIEPLKTAFELIVQASGAAAAATSIVQLLQKAITYAQNLF